MVRATSSRARARQRLRAVDDVLASWQYLEVYLIAIILAILQLPQISRFIIMDADGASLCAPLAAAFDLLVAIGAVDESDAECWLDAYIGATLEVGVYLLLAAALALNLAGQVTRRLARAVGGAPRRGGGEAVAGGRRGRRRRRESAAAPRRGRARGVDADLRGRRICV